MKKNIHFKGYNYLNLPDIKPWQMNNEQFDAWEARIEMMTMNLPTSLFCRLGLGDCYKYKKNRFKFK